MKAEKDKKTGKWLIQYRYTDWQGKRRKSTKRGFATKREAEEWLRNFFITQKADFDILSAFFLYRRGAVYKDICKRTGHLQCGFRTQYGCSLYHYAVRWNCPGKKVY